MNKYIQKVNKLVEEKLNNATKPKGKGLLAPKQNKLKEEAKQNDAVINLIANFIADIRMKRMEYKRDE
jgi:hypothetical protein